MSKVWKLFGYIIRLFPRFENWTFLLYLHRLYLSEIKNSLLNCFGFAWSRCLRVKHGINRHHLKNIKLKTRVWLSAKFTEKLWWLTQAQTIPFKVLQEYVNFFRFQNGQLKWRYYIYQWISTFRLEFICMPILLLFCLLVLAALKLLVFGYFKDGGVIFRFGFSISEKSDREISFSAYLEASYSFTVDWRTNFASPR